MEGILTPEDKKVLRFVSRYLNSLGIQDGQLESEVYDAYDGLDLSDIDVREFTHFSNNYNTEVPEQLYPILEKIMPVAQLKYDRLGIRTDGNDINYARIDFDIDTEKQEISISYWYSYYSMADGDSTTVEESDDDSVNEIIDSVRQVCGEHDYVELRYNGSGDSGYIEGSFEDPSEEVPANVEDYCYRMLESNYGGWEINEGSQGTFYFDLVDRSITLHHTYNTEETDTYTLFEESFKK